jgi:hypothetical protein
MTSHDMDGARCFACGDLRTSWQRVGVPLPAVAV